MGRLGRWRVAMVRSWGNDEEVPVAVHVAAVAAAGQMTKVAVPEQSLMMVSVTFLFWFPLSFFLLLFPLASVVHVVLVVNVVESELSKLPFPPRIR